ncbi:MAG: Co2+/Mg2+ efflux protein ApaG [Planctomycetia bacterium]
MPQTHSSDVTTEGIRVQAAAQYLAAESRPEQRQFVYGYRILIRNTGGQRARLKSRHWVILDADNNRQEVRGPGVIGKYPDLAPGESFDYCSGCPLATKWGTMEGTYTFQREDGSEFAVAIGRFFLAPSNPRIPALAR